MLSTVSGPGWVSAISAGGAGFGVGVGSVVAVGAGEADADALGFRVASPTGAEGDPQPAISRARPAARML
jgi:hypothetical protein